MASIAAARGVTLTRVRADVDRDLVEALGVLSVPTLIGVHDGTEVGRLLGAQRPASIESLVDATLAGSGAVRPTTAVSLIVLRAAAGLLVAGAGVVFGSAALTAVGVCLIGWALTGVLRR